MSVNRRVKRKKLRKLRVVEPRLKELVEETKIHISNSPEDVDSLQPVISRLNNVWRGICKRHDIMEFVDVYLHQIALYNNKKKRERDEQKEKEKKV